MNTVTWPWRLMRFALWYCGEVVASNVAVLRDNLTPGQRSTTGIARYPTACRDDRELTLLAALITLTPGTLTMGTETTGQGERVLYVHGLYHPDADDLRSSLAPLEARLLAAIRRTGGPR